MKNLSAALFIIMIIALSCSHDKPVQIPQKTYHDKLTRELSDSIAKLLSEFELNHDTSYLKTALNLNDKLLLLDTAHLNIYYNLDVRIQLLGMLNKKEKEFLRLEKDVKKKNKDDVDRLIYFGVKYKLKGNLDSSQHYFNKAVDQSNKQLKDSFDAKLILKQVEIFIHQDNNKEAQALITKSLEEHPDNQELKIYKKEFDFYLKMINDYFDGMSL